MILVPGPFVRSAVLRYFAEVHMQSQNCIDAIEIHLVAIARYHKHATKFTT